VGKKTLGSMPRIEHAGKGILEFPWKQADALWAAAEKEGMDTVKEALEDIRDMLGHPEAIVTITTAWADAKTKINDSTDGTTGLTTAKRNMLYAWEGDAAKEASEYVDRIIATSKETEDMLGTMVNTINDFSNIIIKTYKLCIDLINQFASLILTITKNVLDNWKDWFGMGSDIADTLKDFLTEYKDTVKESMDNMKTALDTISNLQVQASGLKVPDPIAPIGLDPGSWRPKQVNK